MIEEDVLYSMNERIDMYDYVSRYHELPSSPFIDKNYTLIGKESGEDILSVYSISMSVPFLVKIVPTISLLDTYCYQVLLDRYLRNRSFLWSLHAIGLHRYKWLPFYKTYEIQFKV